MKAYKLGYQVYSAREEAQKDLGFVFDQIAGMGYDGVEMAGFYGHSAADVKKLLDASGLRAISAHIAIPDRLSDMYRVVADAKEIGCEFIAVPFLPEDVRPGKPGFADTIRKIYQYALLSQEAGIQLLYHNHDFEFEKVSGMFGLDFLYAAVDEQLLKTQLDVCWVKYAGQDPAAYIRKYAGRCPVVHLKDYVGVKGGTQPYALVGQDGKDDKSDGKDVAFEFRPVGHGCQDIPSVLKAGVESGAKWFIVEQDMSVGRTPLEAAKMSYDYLKSLEA